MIVEHPAKPATPIGAFARRRIWWCLGLGIAALVGVWQLVTILQTSPHVWHDFTQDYVAAEDVLAGRNPYRAQNERIGEIFNMAPPKDGPAYSFHPPTTIPFFLPFAYLPYTGAFVAWSFVQLACMWLIVDLTARALERPLSPILGVATALALLAVWPLAQNFVEGQLNVAVTAGIVGYWYAVRTRRPLWAGFALAIAVALKPLAGLYVLWALWRRQVRLLLTAVVTLAICAAVGIALAGVQGTLDYVTVAYPTHADLWPGYQDNASPQGFYTRLFGPSPWRPRPPYPTPGLASGLTLATWALAVGLLFWRLGWRSPDSGQLNREFAALGATLLLVTPIIWPHYYVVLVAPIAVFVAELCGRRSWGWLALLGVALVVLWLPRDLHDWLQNHNLAPRSFGATQLPALLAVYVLGLRVLGFRSGSPAPPPADPA